MRTERALKYGAGVYSGGRPQIQATGVLRLRNSGLHGTAHLGLRGCGVGIHPQPRHKQVPVPTGRGQPLHAADAHQRVALGPHRPHGGCAGAGARVLHRRPLHLPLAGGCAFHHRSSCSTNQARQELEKKTGAANSQVLVSGDLFFSRVPG